MLAKAVYLTSPDSPSAKAGQWDSVEIENFAKIHFQNGDVSTHGVNGVGTLDVLKVLIDRERMLQRGDDTKSRERALGITRMQEAAMWGTAAQEKLGGSR